MLECRKFLNSPHNESSNKFHSIFLGGGNWNVKKWVSKRKIKVEFKTNGMCWYNFGDILSKFNMKIYKKWNN